MGEEGAPASELLWLWFLAGGAALAAVELGRAAAEAMADGGAAVGAVLLLYSLLLSAAAVGVGGWSTLEWWQARSAAAFQAASAAARAGPADFSLPPHATGGGEDGEEWDEERDGPAPLRSLRAGVLGQRLWWGLLARVVVVCSTANVIAELMKLRAGHLSSPNAEGACVRIPLLPLELHWQDFADEAQMECNDKSGERRPVHPSRPRPWTPGPLRPA
jgi:hypothetical protein